jgi:hypothetical protein
MKPLTETLLIMDIEEIEALWVADTIIDREQLDVESLKTPQLHHKYSKLYTREMLRLIKMQNDFKTLKLDKYEHYTQGGSVEAARKGWKLPPIGKVLKTEVDKYLEADLEIIDSNLKIAYQSEKVSLLKSILAMVVARQWQIKGAQDYMKFMAGGIAQ